MLVMTPAAKKLLKKERNRERDARRGRLGEDRHRALILSVIRIIRSEREAGRTATLFNLEGPLRHAIRSDLCRQGWGWSSADLLAKDVMDAALNRLNAIRPSWDEGQPDWAIHRGTLIERTRCARCRKPLESEQSKFCGRICARNYHKDLERIRQADADNVVELVVRTRRRNWAIDEY